MARIRGAAGSGSRPMAAFQRLRGRGTVALLLAGLAGSGGAVAQDAGKPLTQRDSERAERLRQDLREMVGLARDRVFPALVNIRVITVRYWQGKEQKDQSVGSGTIISAEGHVLTNFHVAEAGRKFKCTLSDKREVSATLVGEDPLTDLAVLKLNLDELSGGAPLQVAHFGDSDALEVGDPVMAMGSPLALSRSVTYGIVSNTERILAGSDDELGELRLGREQRTGLFNRWIQHDAAINPGNSGGPLVNLRGEIVGVNARGGGDMGFAIPAGVARSVSASLIEHGEVSRSSFGLMIKSIKKSGLKRGVLVNSIVKGGPADKAGVRAGDVIIAMDGTPVTVWFAEDIPVLLKDMGDRAIGSTVKLSLQRGEESLDVQLTTERMPQDRGDEAAFRVWGVTGMQITDRMARERRLPGTDGVLVSSVRSGSPAALAEPGISAGDIIRAVGGEPIKSLAELVSRYDAILKQEPQPQFTTIEFDSDGKLKLTAVKTREEKDPPKAPELPKGWVGVATQPLSPKLARQLGQPETLGFRITRVYPGTLAAASDLQVGDLIVELNGDRLRPQGQEEADDFAKRVRRFSDGEKIKLKLIRDSQPREVELTLERTRLRPDEAQRDTNRDFELSVRELTFFDRDEARWADDVRGVLVTAAEQTGAAGLGGVGPGDLLQRIGDIEVTDLKSYLAAMKGLSRARPARVVFVVLRGVRTHFQYVEPEWGPTSVDTVSEPE